MSHRPPQERRLRWMLRRFGPAKAPLGKRVGISVFSYRSYKFLDLSCEGSGQAQISGQFVHIVWRQERAQVPLDQQSPRSLVIEVFYLATRALVPHWGEAVDVHDVPLYDGIFAAIQRNAVGT